MKNVKILVLLAILFMVSSCEMSPEEIEPMDNRFILENQHAGEEGDGPSPPPPPTGK